MSSLKLQKIGNSLGFRVSKTDLAKAGFDTSCEYELIAEKGVLILVKKRKHPAKWRFPLPELESEDQEWLDADLTSGAR
jgi:antitoxin component of MazEF toxin-antitoxin module